MMNAATIPHFNLLKKILMKINAAGGIFLQTEIIVKL